MDQRWSKASAEIVGYRSFAAGIATSKTGDYRVGVSAYPFSFLLTFVPCQYVQIWGFTVWTIGSGLLTTIGPDTSIAKLVGFQILAGHGGGATFQTSLVGESRRAEIVLKADIAKCINFVAIQAAVARKDMAVATGAR